MSAAFDRWFKDSPVQVDVPLNSRITIACDLSDEVQFGIWWARERYEIGPTRLFKSLLSPGAVFLDIGANVGYFSLVAASRVLPDGKVFAFEPMSVQFARLDENIRRNRLDHVTPLRLALSDAPQSAVISLEDPHNTGSASLRPRDQSHAAYRETVECITLDSFVQSAALTRVDILKIDVEGLETAVLRGARQTVVRFQPVLLVEVDDRFQRQAGSSREQLFGWLRDLGYRGFRILRNGKLEALSEPCDGTLIAFLPPGRPAPASTEPLVHGSPVC